MKKIITFSNFIALLGIIALLVGFAPAIAINSGTGSVYEHFSINMFQAAFGAKSLSLIREEGEGILNFTLVPNVGVIIAMILLVAGVVLSILKNKFKFITILSFACYLASAILFIKAPEMVANANVNRVDCPAQINYFAQEGGLVAIYTILFVAAGFSVIEALRTFIKPKQKKEEIY